ncbi:unnamed protein product [Protopolystoma xenopodis]|uniref:Uncharacterized protein n=1 Tax=Protopolystoma xenopodis TaxID=117903 RepID=A0A3S5A2B2_9PLAT|nr:unnamed protein product [Protopolystoma xenopodis]
MLPNRNFYSRYAYRSNLVMANQAKINLHGQKQAISLGTLLLPYSSSKCSTSVSWTHKHRHPVSHAARLFCLNFRWRGILHPKDWGPLASWLYLASQLAHFEPLALAEPSTDGDADNKGFKASMGLAEGRRVSRRKSIRGQDEQSKRLSERGEKGVKPEEGDEEEEGEMLNLPSEARLSSAHNLTTSPDDDGSPPSCRDKSASHDSGSDLDQTIEAVDSELWLRL